MAGLKRKQKQGMVDISEKDITKRVAVASAEISFGRDAFNKLLEDACPKGNVFETARVAGIMAAKNTPSIIPMCHPLSLSKVMIDYVVVKKSSKVVVTAEVSCLGRTGVEMEALTAVSAACLTIYDMMKWADKRMVISEVKLLKKTGGKSGDFKR